jgi:hypothetical protein
LQIKEFAWDDSIIDHIAEHGISPQEVEEAAYYSPLIFRGRQNRHYVLGRTVFGRYLMIVIEYLGQGRAKVITARDMDKRERRRFTRR